jgi:hypothetical protein
VSAEPLTPVGVEAKLRQLVNDLGRAQVTLATLRDREVDAKHALNSSARPREEAGLVRRAAVMPVHGPAAVSNCALGA